MNFHFPIQLPIKKFVIKNHSMEPAYKEGEQVLVWKFGNIKKGDVVVFRYNHKHLIKRVVRIYENQLIVTGDNTYDNLKLPPIQKHDMIGKVIWKL